jgi:hypothetical protein
MTTVDGIRVIDGEGWKRAGEKRWGQGLDSDDDREGPKRVGEYFVPLFFHVF